MQDAHSTIVELNAFCQLGRDVILTEAKEIQALAERINHFFANACQLLLTCQGRIIVMGIGKSGHVGKKIAGTFASTGSPAFFVHPGEASHGDLGMITAKDIVLMISNSGETEECLSVLPTLKRLRVPLITITGAPQSTLALAADVNLDVRVSKEACPLGLTPTSSTTACLVMGDALAVALLEKRGFSAADFALSHPGGQLGRLSLLRIDDLIHKAAEIPTVLEHTSMRKTLDEMSRKGFGMTTVVNELGKLVGVYTDGDIRRTLRDNVDLDKTPVSACMSKHPKLARKNMLAQEALQIMETNKITSLVLIDEEGCPIGLLHIHDLLRARVT